MVEATGRNVESVPNTTSARLRRRIAGASLSGTLIEWYDFFIYGIAAALVFPQIYFPALGGAAGTAASIATFGVAFVARPFGAILFGHFGDRHGRKKTLVTTLMIMGISTFLVGLTPSAAQIGVAAPIILVVLRILQGLSAGGEWAGAVLFSGEYAPRDKRGFWGMFPMIGGPLATILANITFLMTGFGMSQEAFLSWGWRVPFLLSAILIAVGLFVRLKVDETPVFRGEVESRAPARAPLLEAFRAQSRDIVFASGIGVASMSFTYFISTYLTAYATTTLGLSRTEVFTIAAIGGAFVASGNILSAIYSDHVGRRPVLIGANIAAIIWSLCMFQILKLDTIMTYGVVVFVTLFLAGATIGPVGAYLPELFSTRHRYSATAVSYNAAGLLGGALAPILAAPIVETYGTFAYGLFLAAMGVLSATCVCALRETKGSTMEQEDHNQIDTPDRPYV